MLSNVYLNFIRGAMIFTVVFDIFFIYSWSFRVLKETPLLLNEEMSDKTFGRVDEMFKNRKRQREDEKRELNRKKR